MPREKAVGVSFRDSGEEVAPEFCRPAHVSGSGLPPLWVSSAENESLNTGGTTDCNYSSPCFASRQDRAGFLFCRISEKESTLCVKNCQRSMIPGMWSPGSTKCGWTVVASRRSRIPIRNRFPLLCLLPMSQASFIWGMPWTLPCRTSSPVLSGCRGIMHCGSPERTMHLSQRKLRLSRN